MSLCLFIHFILQERIQHGSVKSLALLYKFLEYYDRKEIT